VAVFERADIHNVKVETEDDATDAAASLAGHA
jgi:hypothetical protein